MNVDESEKCCTTEFMILKSDDKSANNGIFSDTMYLCTKELLGKGSFSKVYMGYILPLDFSLSQQIISKPDLKHFQKVAIKKIRMEKVQKNKNKSQLESEIEIMKAMKHENIVNLLDVITYESNIYLILEFCTLDLKTYLQKKVLKEKVARKILTQLAYGLKYLRSKDIIHRDLKPQNILLRVERPRNPLEKRRIIVKIADFGFAKIVGSEGLAETMCGSPLYMAPEIMQKHRYTNKADLWSVGVILYEMLYARHPYENVQDIFDLKQKIETNIIKFGKKRAISSSCKDLLRSLLQKIPEKRISWTEFFTHEWFYSSLDIIKVSKSQMITSDSYNRHVNHYCDPGKGTAVSELGSCSQSGTFDQKCPIQRSRLERNVLDDVSIYGVTGSVLSDNSSGSTSTGSIVGSPIKHSSVTMSISPVQSLPEDGSFSQSMHDEKDPRFVKCVPKSEPISFAKELPQAHPRRMDSSSLMSINSSPFLHIISDYSMTEHAPNRIAQSQPVFKHVCVPESRKYKRTKSKANILEEGSRKDSSSIGKSIVDFMSTSFGLIRDSFHQFNSIP